MYIPEELEDFIAQRNRAHSEFREEVIKILKQHEHDVPHVEGYFLQLLNGRNGHCEEIEEIGFKGPCFGPLKSFHISYLTSIKLEFEGESSSIPPTRMMESIMEISNWRSEKPEKSDHNMGQPTAMLVRDCQGE
ncbi:hypothetical protein HA052_04385 [Chromobacterium haemolyticum]|uniref:Uncharacterized protein n=1 Tax=Chromobacterium fluminis TaxID=3044269 RepID=A0ABX0L5T9_9NEIS|nr:hypothetical protein [Chromobacterium haemolyticum]NHR04428.1 hypothetical protein [Chromobacterium haemolyticum]